MTKNPTFLNIAWDSVGSTYDKDTLLSRLYLENQYLLRERKRFSVQGKALPNEEMLASDEEFAFVRQYLQETRTQLPTGERHLILANEYPSLENQYANGFIHRRIKNYQKAGHSIDVVAYGKRVRRDVYIYDGVNVLSGYDFELLGLLASRDYKSLSVHFMNSEMWAVLKAHVSKIPNVIVYVHGFEVRNWSRLPYEIYSRNQLDDRIERSLRNRDLWSQLIDHESGITDFSFVSHWWKKAVEEDLGIIFPPASSQIIHNVIDEELFPYRKKAADQRFKILWVRNARAWNYGADIAATILERLKASRFWSEIEVTIVGDGHYFSEFDRFESDANVTIHRGFISQQEISDLHKSHGLFLIPSRFDTQGVSRDEAMSSGLVPITSPVAAIPEFVDDECAILGVAENIDVWVNQLFSLMEDPTRFIQMSEAAAQRVRRQSSAEQTVDREMKLMTKDRSR